VSVDRGGYRSKDVATCVLVHVAEHDTTSGQVGVWARRGPIEATQDKLRGGSRTRRRVGAVRTQRRGAVLEIGRRGRTAAERGYAASRRLTTMLCRQGHVGGAQPHADISASTYSRARSILYTGARVDTTSQSWTGTRASRKPSRGGTLPLIGAISTRIGAHQAERCMMRKGSYISPLGNITEKVGRTSPSSEHQASTAARQLGRLSS
jgi:hypothetical protein